MLSPSGTGPPHPVQLDPPVPACAGESIRRRLVRIQVQKEQELDVEDDLLPPQRLPVRELLCAERPGAGAWLFH
jgi:hypothetical protein